MVKKDSSEFPQILDPRNPEKPFLQAWAERSAKESGTPPKGLTDQDAREAAWCFQRVLFHETKKKCNPVDDEDFRILGSLSSLYAVLAIVGVVQPEDVVSEIIKTYKECREEQSDDAYTKKTRLFSKEEFLVKEVAELFEVKSTKTVTRWIKGTNEGKLKQLYPHGKILLKDCLDFSRNSKSYRGLNYDFQLFKRGLLGKTHQPAAKVAKTKRKKK